MIKRAAISTLRLVGSAFRAALVGVLAVALIAGGVALADYSATQGTGTTFASVVIATKHYMAMVICDATVGETQCTAVNSSGQLATTGSIFGPTATGSAAANPPVLMGGTVDGTATGNVDNWKVSGGIGYVTSSVTGEATNPTNTLALPSGTTAYTAGQLICTNATAATCNTALASTSFAIANSAGAAIIPRLRLSSNDATSGAWNGQTIQVDLWSAAPTFTNGDRGTWALATGSANHISAYTCVMSAENGDGVYAECAPTVGNFSLPKLASGTSIFWSLDAITGSGTTGASKVFTLTAELLN